MNDSDSSKASIFIMAGILAVLLFVGTCLSYSIVSPGTRGVLVTMGEVTETAYPEGIVWHWPFISSIHPLSVRQETGSIKADCFSADLQQVLVDLKILYRVPETSIVKIYQNYAGIPFDTLIAPRVQEALKEVTAMRSAENIAKEREIVKLKALEAARIKVGDLLVIEDLVIENVSLSARLGEAIEQKMVQEQEAAKAQFIQHKTEIEAKTLVIRAGAEAEAISIRGNAIKQNPGIIDLQIAEKWDGKTPLVVGAGNGANILLPLGQH